MDVFDSRHRAFKMDRRSPLALEMKETVSKKLVEFLGCYSDDVLAEYIVVLVCNGKHQDQARDDLEAFLGDNCNSFVDWLWGHLSEKVKPSKISAGTSNLTKESAKNGDSHGTEIVENQSNQIQLPLLEGCNACKPKSEPVAFLASNATMETCAECTLSDTNVKKICRCPCGSGTREQSLTKMSCLKDAMHGSALVRCYPINSDNDVKHIQCGGQIKQMKGGTHAVPHCQHLQASMNESVMINARIDCTENLCVKPRSTTNNAEARVSGRTAENILANHVAKKRGSVWDRLGRPTEEDDIAKDKEILLGAVNIMKRQRRELSGEVLDRHVVLSGSRLNNRLIGEALAIEKSCIKRKKSIAVEECKRPGREVAMECQNHNLNQAGQYLDMNSPNDSVLLRECVDKHISYEGTSRRLPNAFDLQCGSSQNLKLVGETRKISLSSGSQGPSSTSLCNMSATPREQMEREAVSASVEMKAQKSQAFLDGSVSHAETEHSSHESMQSEVQDVKSRLHQIEIEMQKLRSKHSEMKSEVKSHHSTNFGGRTTLLHPDEDIESRTVFLTNVHFAATKEDLSSHFMKCGPVVRVVILTDVVTAQPNGSAYVIFAAKEAVNCAIALNGTSFMSRILKIVRKSDVSKTTRVQPLQSPVHELAQPSVHASYAKTPFVKRQYAASHLQWKRDSSNDSLSASTAGNDSSSVSEHGTHSLTYIRTAGA